MPRRTEVAAAQRARAACGKKQGNALARIESAFFAFARFHRCNLKRRRKSSENELLNNRINMSTIVETKVEDFAARLAVACKTSEPAEIARLLEVTYQTAKNYLDGRLPAAEVLITIAVKTEVSLNWLLTGEGAAFNEETAVQRKPQTPPLEEKWAIRIKDMELLLKAPKDKVVLPNSELVTVLNDALLNLVQESGSKAMKTE